MVVASSLRLHYHLTSTFHGSPNQFKVVQDDAWLCTRDITKRNAAFVKSKNRFLCRSIFLPAGGAGNNTASPIIQNAPLLFKRLYNSVCSTPFVYKLIPAIGVVALSWGLLPLMRLGWSIFLHKNGGSWKKSSTYFFATSYVQPLLLWTGVLLICRALDPVVLPSEASQAVKQRILHFVRSFSTVVAFAFCLSSLIQQSQKFFMEASDSSDTRNMGFQFAGKTIYTAVWVASVSLFMELLGFSTQKWLTAGGLGTVLLTLAGREIFTNFLSSVMIHATRPFVVNEWIQTKIEGYEVSGTVEHVGWWSPTIIRGDDREAVYIPNHKFTVNVVRNLTQKNHWRIKTHIAISHLDVNKISSIVADMRKVLAKNPQVEQQRLHRRIFLDNINPENQALQIMVSCFVKTSRFEEYLCVKEAILLDLLRVISHHRARLATPIRTIRKVYTEADVQNIPFSESSYPTSRPAANHPFLLIEPSYKINGENRTKASKKDENSDTSPKSASKIDGRIGDQDRVDVSDTGLSDSDIQKTVSPPPVTKREEETVATSSTARAVLDENIVLGVALEGSKRTLPIDEEMVTPSGSVEDKKDDQVSPIGSFNKGDNREKQSG